MFLFWWFEKRDECLNELQDALSRRQKRDEAAAAAAGSVVLSNSNVNLISRKVDMVFFLPSVLLGSIYNISLLLHAVSVK